MVTILLIKSKLKPQQTTVTATTDILERIVSETVENRLVHDITTNENIAYVAHQIL